MRLSWPGVDVDLERGAVRRRGSGEAALTEREADLLRYLWAHRGEIVGREDLLRDVWGQAPDVVSRACDNTVRRLRTKLEADPARPAVLVTVHGGGYRLTPPASQADADPDGDLLVHEGRTLDLRRGEVRGPHGTVPLTSNELELLSALRAAHGAPVDRDALQRGIWGSAAGRAVEHAVSRLRRKVEADPAAPTLLVTTAQGYRLDLPAAGAVQVSGARPPPLPAERDRRVGRDDLLEQVVAGTASHRLVTLVGLGGMGKSRIALAAARRAEGTAWWVDPEGDLLGALARVLSLTPQATDVPRAAAAALDAAPSLLVVDGAGAGDAAAIAALLDGSRRLRIVVTARQPLRLRGELVVPVPPLPPEDAAALLRAAVGRPLGPDELPLLPAIVERTGGVPLALELVAAHARTAQLGEILRQLAVAADRVLVAVDADRPARHASMEEALRSSLDGLSGPARAALRRLSLSAGPVPPDVAEAVVSDGGWIPGRFEELADAGLLSRDPAGRWRVPPVVRDAAVAPPGAERDADAARHAVAWARVAGAVRPDLPAEGWHRLGEQLVDLERAAALGAATGERSAAVACAVTWWAIVEHLGPWSTSLAPLDAATAVAVTDAERCDVATARARAWSRQDRVEDAFSEAARAVDAAQRAGDPDREAAARLERARIGAALDRAADVAEDLGWLGARPSPPPETWVVAGAWARRTSLAECRRLLQRAVVAASRARDLRTLAEAHAVLGSSWLEDDALPDAERHLAAALRVAEGIGDTPTVGLAHGYRVFALKLRDREAGVRAQRELAQWFAQRGNRERQATCLVGVATTLVELGDLDGAADALDELDVLGPSARHATEVGRLRGLVALHRGRPDEAIARARAAFAAARARQDVVSELASGTQLADILRLAGHPDEARPLTRELLDLARAHGSALREVVALLELGEIERGAGRPAEAREWFSAAAARAGDAYPLHRAHAERALADLAAARA